VQQAFRNKGPQAVDNCKQGSADQLCADLMLLALLANMLLVLHCALLITAANVDMGGSICVLLLLLLQQ
jgi:hypothetical protein